eukprot:353822-Chlamydomonas_euryale.AAC.12
MPSGPLGRPPVGKKSVHTDKGNLSTQVGKCVHTGRETHPHRQGNVQSCGCAECSYMPFAAVLSRHAKRTPGEGFATHAAVKRQACHGVGRLGPCAHACTDLTTVMHELHCVPVALVMHWWSHKRPDCMGNPVA